MSAEPTLLVDKLECHIAVVTLNRPKARNSVNPALANALDAAVKELEADSDIWTVILTGAGDIAFSAGADLKAVSEGLMSKLMLEDTGFAGFVHATRSKPWIAAVDGFALAGGCEIALACDMIIASENSFFGLPEVSIGLIPSAGGAYRLVRALPRAIAIEALLTAGRLSAQRVAELGMINHVVAKGQALSRALELAQQINANGPIAVRESLAIARKSADLDDDGLRQLSEEAQIRIEETEDFHEGPLAFIEKRPAKWTGR